MFIIYQKLLYIILLPNIVIGRISAQENNVSWEISKFIHLHNVDSRPLENWYEI